MLKNQYLSVMDDYPSLWWTKPRKSLQWTFVLFIQTRNAKHWEEYRGERSIIGEYHFYFSYPLFSHWRGFWNSWVSGGCSGTMRKIYGINGTSSGSIHTSTTGPCVTMAWCSNGNDCWNLPTRDESRCINKPSPGKLRPRRLIFNRIFTDLWSKFIDNCSFFFIELAEVLWLRDIAQKIIDPSRG